MTHPKWVSVSRSPPVGELDRGLAGLLANRESDLAAAMAAGQSLPDPLVAARKRLVEFEREMSSLETNMLAGLVSDDLRTLYASLEARRLSLIGSMDLESRVSSAPTTVEPSLHFVGSLPPSAFPDLLALPDEDREPVDADRFPGLTACQTRALVFGVDRRVVLTHSTSLRTAQARGFDQALAKTTRALTELAATLARGKTRREKTAVLAEVTRITHPRWVGRVLSTELTDQSPAGMRLTFTIDPAARHAPETEIFGKRLLVTDHDDWTIPEVVAAYRSQNDVESGFRRLKDPHAVGFSPYAPTSTWAIQTDHPNTCLNGTFTAAGRPGQEGPASSAAPGSRCTRPRPGCRTCSGRSR